MKTIALITLALLSTAALAEDWQRVPGTASRFVDRDSIVRRGRFVVAKIRIEGLPTASHTETVHEEYDCEAQQRRFVFSDIDTKFVRIILGSSGEMTLRALCTRSVKF